MPGGKSNAVVIEIRSTPDRKRISSLSGEWQQCTRASRSSRACIHNVLYEAARSRYFWTNEKRRISTIFSQHPALGCHGTANGWTIRRTSPLHYLGEPESRGHHYACLDRCYPSIRILPPSQEDDITVGFSGWCDDPSGLGADTPCWKTNQRLLAMVKIQRSGEMINKATRGTHHHHPHLAGVSSSWVGLRFAVAHADAASWLGVVGGPRRVEISKTSYVKKVREILINRRTMDMALLQVDSG